MKTTYPNAIKRRLYYLFLSDWESSFKTIAATIFSGIVAYIGFEVAGHRIPLDQYTKVFFFLCLMLYAVASISSVWKQATEKMYDTKLALFYCNLFFNEMREMRDTAANALYAHVYAKAELPQNLNELDEILDVFEDIAFFLDGRQISDIIVHHYFFHHFRMYYEASKQYITEVQKNDSPAWGHLSGLSERMYCIEKHKVGSNATYTSERLIEDLRVENSPGLRKMIARALSSSRHVRNFSPE